MSLSFDEYQRRASTTAIYRQKNAELVQNLAGRPIPELSNLLNKAYTGLGMGEVGEIQGKMKKIFRDSKGVVSMETRQTISGELGDALWYLAVAADEFGLSLSEIAEQNLDKLADRRSRGVIQGSGDNR
jgi:NTP pyrophosphatase (non-canonical NTP hydrolase)